MSNVSTSFFRTIANSFMERISALGDNQVAYNALGVVGPMGISLERAREGAYSVEPQNQMVKPRFIHIKDRHTAPVTFRNAEDKQFYTGLMLESQLRVIEAIRQHPGCPVLFQGLDEDRNLDACSPGIIKEAKWLFSNDIPTTVNALNGAQREFLCDYQAANLLLFLGEIPILYKTLHKDANGRTLLDAPTSMELLFTQIPKDVVSCAQESVRHYTKVLVVFGAMHDFKQFSEEAGFQHEVIDTLQPLPFSRVNLLSHRFIHIRQMHKVPGKEDYLDAVVSSQLKVIQAIRRYPHCPVLAESLDERITKRDCDREDILTAKLLFSEGIPLTLEGLSPRQKAFIYHHHAPDLLLFLGELPALEKTIHKEVSKEMLQKALAGDVSMRDEGREKEAVLCAKETFATQACSTVLVVFGALHDFKPLCEAVGLIHEQIDAV